MKKEKVKIPATVEELGFKKVEVKVRGESRDDFEQAVRIFKSIVQKEKILSLYKQKQTYEKPSVKRRRKRKEAEEKAFLESKAQEKNKE